MFSISWLFGLCSRPVRVRATAPHRSSARTPSLEPLEERALLSANALSLPEPLAPPPALADTPAVVALCRTLIQPPTGAGAAHLPGSDRALPFTGRLAGHIEVIPT